MPEHLCCNNAHMHTRVYKSIIKGLDLSENLNMFSFKLFIEHPITWVLNSSYSRWNASYTMKILIYLLLLLQVASAFIPIVTACICSICSQVFMRSSFQRLSCQCQSRVVHILWILACTKPCATHLHLHLWISNSIPQLSKVSRLPYKNGDNRMQIAEVSEHFRSSAINAYIHH